MKLGPGNTIYRIPMKILQEGQDITSVIEKGMRQLDLESYHFIDLYILVGESLPADPPINFTTVNFTQTLNPSLSLAKQTWQSFSIYRTKPNKNNP